MSSQANIMGCAIAGMLFSGSSIGKSPSTQSEQQAVVLCCCRDVDQLEAAMDSTDGQQLISAVASLQAAAAAGSAASANATAAQRSGRRGVAARKAAVAAEKAAAETAAAGKEMTHEGAAAKAQVGGTLLCMVVAAM
jgi:hypothetical protein